MAIDPITTTAFFDKTLNNILKVQNDLYTLQGQISSGRAVDTYSDLTSIGQVQNVSDLQSKLQRIDDYNKNNQMIEDRMLSMDQSLQNIIDIAIDMVTNSASWRSTNKGVMNIAQIARNKLGEIRDNLNVSFENRFLFSGMRTDTVPVGDIVNVSNVVNGVITSNYYNGDDNVIAAQVNDSLSLNYSLKADDPIFQNLIGAINNVITADSSSDDNLMSQAYELLNNSVSQLNQLRSNLGNNIKALQDARDENDSVKTYLNTTLINITETDLPSATTKMYNDQAILQAAYATFARASSLSLTNYLK